MLTKGEAGWMDLTALGLVKALEEIIRETDELVSRIPEDVNLLSIDDPEGGDDEASVRIGFGGRDLFDLKIERVP
jgi:hypothetical protein